jgi:hypothetical protein
VGEPRRRRHADHLQVLRLGGDVVRFRQRQLRPAGGEPRFRLRDVGARDLAGGEAVARLPQRHLEHVHVAALQLQDGRGLQQVHVGGGGAEQHVLLGRAQRLAGGKHLALGLARAGRRLEAVEERLRGGQPIGLHRDGAFGLGVDCRNPRGPRRPHQLIQILVGQARGAAHARAIARERGGNVLVDRAGGGALGIELGIVLVGLDQGLFHAAGARAVAHQASVGGKRRDPEGRRRGCGKRCNLRAPRDCRSPPSPPQHAQTPPPCRAALLGRALHRALMANVSHNWAGNPLRPQRKRQF